MSKKIRFNVNAYTAKLIGRENVSNLEGAILELVKNTYDADATKCILYYDEKNKVLYIMDNGVGMSEEIIERHWMTIGNSSKSTNFISKSGRVQTGAKGIGRFALDRTGDTCVMYTKNQESKDIIQWKVDWRDFDKKENLTDITAEIDYIKGNLYDNIDGNKYLDGMLKKYFKNTGTIFKITNLREEWNIDLIKNIKKSLATLIPPDIENEFAIYFFYEEQNEKEALIISENIDAYDYKIQFRVQNNGTTIIKLDRNEFDFKDKLDEVIKKAKFKKEDKEYFLGKEKIINTTLEELVDNTETKGLGKFDGTIYFNKISTVKEDSKKYYYKDITGRKNFSDIFGGIKLYRDNFRVRPYGEKDSSSYDWLLLGNRRAKSPAAISHTSGKWRVSADQISGVINISRMNVNLPDQANRQGIVETKEFKLLKEILIEIISKFEEDRQYVGRKLNELYYKENETEQTQEEVREKAKKQEENKKEKNDKEDYKVDAGKVHKAFEEKDEQIRDLQDENRMLRNLATTGIVVNQYIHETKESVNNVGTNIMVVKELLTEDRDIENAIKKINDAQKYVETMNSWYDVTLGSIRRDKRTMKFNDINSLISTQMNLWKKVLERQNIDIIYNGKDIPDIKCFPFEIESIISNLIANSVYAFKGINNKKINITLLEFADGIKIEYSDTGCGLIPEYKKQPDKILEALETSKRNRIGEKIGTGMGMWIIAGIVKSYDGKIDLSKNKKEKTGFHIDIYLKTLKRKEGE